MKKNNLYKSFILQRNTRNNNDSEKSLDDRKNSMLLYVSGGVLSLIVIIAIIIFTSHNHSEVEKMNDVFLIELATGMADKISALTKESNYLLKTSKAALLHHIPDEDKVLAALLDISSVSGFDNLYISLNGEIPVDASNTPLKTKIPLTLEGIEDGEVFVSEPSIDEYSGRSFFTMGTPLYLNSHKVGELYGVYYLDEYSKQLDLKTFGGEAFFHLCTVGGTPLVLSGNNDNLFKDGDMYSFIGSLDMQNDHTVESIREDMINGKTTLLKYKIQGEQRTAVMVTVPGTDWCVISIILNEVTVKMAQEINQSTLFYSIFVIVIFGCFVASALIHSLKKESKLRDALLSSRQLAKKLKLTVETDALTKVYSRTTATERIIDLIGELETKGQMHTLVIADVDNFKQINDTYGHQIGDIYLVEFVKAVGQCLRTEDVFGRLGGDEFIIFLNDIDSKEDAQKIAVRILETVNTITIPNVSLDQVGISLGLVMIPTFGTDYESLNNMADKALYDAKKAGKSTFSFYGDLIEKK